MKSRKGTGKDRRRWQNRAAGGAAICGVAGLGYLAARVRGARQRLSDPRKPLLWRPGRGQSVLLEGIDVVDVKRGQALRNRGILFRDGQLVDLVATGDLDLVEAAHVFDCRGLVAMPGMINAHCHTLLPGASVPGLDLLLSLKRQAVRNLEECALRGITTVRDASSLPVVLNDLARRIETLDILGPRIIHCGVALAVKGGYPDHMKPLPAALAGRYGNPVSYVDSPESARLAVKTAVENGGRYIKTFLDGKSLQFGRKSLNTLDDETIRAIVEEAHRLGRRVGAHQTERSGFRRALKLGIDDFEHVPIDGELTENDISRFVKGNHNITPTASVCLALGIAPAGDPALSNELVARMKAGRDTFIRETCPLVSEGAIHRSNLKMVKTYEETSASRGGGMLFDNMLFVEGIVRGQPNIRRLYEEGASICCGNDGGNPLSFPATIFTEMEIFEWLDFSRADILRSATINAARLLDMESELGSLEAGKLADIVVLSGNPLKDIRAVREVEAVFRSGILLSKGFRFPEEVRVAEKD